MELGSGEFFGELALLGDEHINADVRSLGYSKLLMLSARDLHAVLARDADLRERIDKVVKQRLRAIEVWRQFSETGQVYPPGVQPPPRQPAEGPLPAPE